MQPHCSAGHTRCRCMLQRTASQTNIAPGNKLHTALEASVVGHLWLGMEHTWKRPWKRPGDHLNRPLPLPAHHTQLYSQSWSLNALLKMHGATLELKPELGAG